MYINPNAGPFRWTLKNLQIVVAGLLGGSGLFLALAICLVTSGKAPQAGMEMAFLPTLTVGVAALAFLLQMIVSAVLLAAARPRILRGLTGASAGEEGAAEGGDSPAGPDQTRQGLWEHFCKSTVVSAAILEAAALFCVVVYLMTQSHAVLVLGVALTIAIVGKMPTQARADEWLDEQTALLRQAS